MLTSQVRAEEPSVDAVKMSEATLGNLENAVNSLVREYKNPVALTRQFPMQRRLIDARVFFELENYEPASILLYELVERAEFKKNHEYSNALVLLGRCLRQLGNPLGARKYLRRGLKSSSIKTREEALYHLIDLALSEGDLKSLREVVSTIGSPGSVKTRYALAKAMFLLKDYKRSISLLKSIPSSEPVYSLSRYYLGASQTALKRYKAAIKTFTRITAIKPKGPEAIRARDLSLLAIGRLEMELGRIERSVAAYQRINRKSPYYERALMETTVAFIKREQFERALQTIDILLLIVGDEQLSIEAHVLRGKLNTNMANYKEAVKSYERILDRFAPIRNELNRFAKKRSNIDRFFTWLLDRASDSGSLRAPLTERSVKYLESTPAMKQVVRVFGSLGADREQLRVANKLAVDLARVLTSSNRVELFPQLKEGWTRALALQNQLINLSTTVLDYQYQQGFNSRQRDNQGEMDELVKWRHNLEEKFSRLPTTFEEYENRQSQIDARYVNLQRKSFLVEQTVKLLKRQLLAIETHVNKQQFGKDGKKLTEKREGRIRTEIEDEKTRLTSLFKDLIRLRDEIKAESERVGTGDVVDSGERDLKQLLLSAHKREGLRYDDRGEQMDPVEALQFSTLARQRYRIFKNVERLHEVIELIDKRVTEKAKDLQSLIDAEKKHLVEYNVEMKGYERKGRKLARRMGRRLFKRAHRQMKKVVLDADWGMINVSWQRKIDESKELNKLEASKQEKEEELRVESDRLLLEVGGDGEEDE
jgi:tetratricopeptide (TPR) repeat protein